MIGALLSAKTKPRNSAKLNDLWVFSPTIPLKNTNTPILFILFLRNLSILSLRILFLKSLSICNIDRIFDATSRTSSLIEQEPIKSKVDSICSRKNCCLLSISIMVSRNSSLISPRCDELIVLNSSRLLFTSIDLSSKSKPVGILSFFAILES